MMSESIKQAHATLEDLVPKVQEIVQAYRDQVLGAIANCMDECADVFIEEAVKISPYDESNHTTPHYRDSWAVKRLRKAKYVRYIGNTKKVKAHYSDAEPSIPLINILEYTKRMNKDNKPVARPVVNKALERSESQIINIIINNIGKVGK